MGGCLLREGREQDESEDMGEVAPKHNFINAYGHGYVHGERFNEVKAFDGQGTGARFAPKLTLPVVGILRLLAPVISGVPILELTELGCATSPNRWQT